jgi:hypothetical protein
LGSQTEQEHGLELFENRELEVIFEPNRNKVIERWKKIIQEKRLNMQSPLHYYGAKITEDEMGGMCSMHGIDAKLI